MTNSPKANEVPSVTNKLAEHHGEAIVPSPTDDIEVTADEEPSAIINEMYEEQPIPTGYALIDTKDVRKLVIHDCITSITICLFSYVLMYA